MSITHQCSKKIKTARRQKSIILFSHALSSPLLSLSINRNHHLPPPTTTTKLLPSSNFYHKRTQTTSIAILFHPRLVKPPLVVVNAQLGTNHEKFNLNGCRLVSD